MDNAYRTVGARFYACINGHTRMVTVLKVQRNGYLVVLADATRLFSAQRFKI